MAQLTAVVALLALCAISGHVPITSAGVASLPTAAAIAAAVSATLRAVARNVAVLSALVALLATAAARVAIVAAILLRALARDMPRLAAAVARFLLLRGGAVTAQMSLATAVVACRRAFAGAITSLGG